MEEDDEIEFLQQEIPSSPIAVGPVIRARWRRRSDSADESCQDHRRSNMVVELQRAAPQGCLVAMDSFWIVEQPEDEESRDDEVCEQIEVVSSTRDAQQAKRFRRGFFKGTKLFGS